MTTNIYLARLLAEERERELRNDYRYGYRLVRESPRRGRLKSLFRTPRHRVTGDSWATA